MVSTPSLQDEENPGSEEGSESDRTETPATLEGSVHTSDMDSAVVRPAKPHVRSGPSLNQLRAACANANKNDKLPRKFPVISSSHLRFAEGVPSEPEEEGGGKRATLQKMA